VNKLVLFVGLSLPFALHAQDLAAAKRASQTCVACHGPEGHSLNPLWPNLAGQKKDYIVKQLHEFRSGDRKNVLMNPMAKMLSDEQIETLATYFSEVK
jgi:cytochrome c553